MRLSHALVVSFALIGAGCSNPRSQVVNEANKDQITSQVAHSNRLSIEEKQLFDGFVLRATMAAARDGSFGAKKAEVSYGGKTVGQIIDEQRLFVAQQKADNERLIRLTAEAKAKADALAAEIKKAVTIAVVDKRTDEGSLFAYAYLNLVVDNASGKDIRGFSGHLKIRDTFGDELRDIPVKVAEPVQAGGQHSWEQFVDSSSIERATFKDLKFEWIPEQVLFADGSQLGPLSVRPAP